VQVPWSEFGLLTPELVLAGAGLLLLLIGSLRRFETHRGLAAAAVAALVLAAIALVWVGRESTMPRVILSGMFVIDRFALFWKSLVLIATAATVVLSRRFVAEAGYKPAEYYALLLLAASGMAFMVSGIHLLSIWISLELMSLSSYVLAGYFKRQSRSNEAAVKYFVLGALSSATLLFGVSLLYGATGQLQLGAIAGAVPEALREHGAVLLLGWFFLAAGLFFKVSAVPFHVWTPDVYVGAPTPVTAFLATASKTAAFAILLRIFYQGFGHLVPTWQAITAAIAALSMVWGNLAALTQTNVKRMLAYSSIAHAGYILLGVLVVNEVGAWAVLFYLAAYVFMTMGAFGGVVLLERREYAGESYSDYAGLARRAPVLSACMVIFLLGLTGIPPTAGFVGKVYLFAGAIKAGWTWLAVVGVLTSAVSLYYYFGLVLNMYLKEPDEASVSPSPAPAVVALLGVLALATIVLGVLPGPLVDLARHSLLPLP
jgi:NADH-quinone oxidoreductase subunit N